MMLSTSSLCEINQTDGPSLLLSDTELGKNVPFRGDGLPIKSMEVQDDSVAKSSLADGRSEHANMGKYSTSSADVDLPEEEKPQLDRQCTRVLGHGLSVVTEEENGNPQTIPDVLVSRPPVLMDSQVNHSAELCAPDTLDTQQDSGSRTGDKATSMTELVADTAFSEEPISGSHSDDGRSYLTGSSEKSDYDTVGGDIAKSMLSIPLPQAIPFLTYSSRKKKRELRPPKEPTCEVKSEDKLVGAIPRIDVISQASMHAKSDVEGVKRADPSTVHADQARLVLENIKYIVPDSLDDDQSEDLAANKLQQSSNNADNVSANFQDSPEPYGKSDSLNTTELLYNNTSNIHNKTSRFKETLSHDELLKDCDMSAQMDSVLASHSTVGCQSYIPTNHFVKDENLRSIAEANSMYSGHSSKNAEVETILDSKVKTCDDFAEHTPFSATKNSLPGNCCQKKEEYSVPLSEIIICRNDGDKCLPGTDHTAEIFVSSESCQLFGISNSDIIKSAFGVQGKRGRQISYTKDENAEKALAQSGSLSILQDHALPCAFTKDIAKCIDGSDMHDRNSEACLQQCKIEAQHCESADAGVGDPKSFTSCVEEDIVDTGVNCPVRQISSESCQLFGISNSDIIKSAFGVQGKRGRQISYTKDENAEKALAQSGSLSILQEHALPCAFTKDIAKCVDGSDMHDRNSEACLQQCKIEAQHCESADPGVGDPKNFTSHVEEDIVDTGVNCPVRQKSYKEIEGSMTLVGCYNHPMQISSVKLAEVGHEIYICVSCGPLVDRERDLFLYKLLCEEPSSGSPCMSGHTSMRLPSLKDEFGREVDIDKSGLQFTPDARALVMIDSIRMPYCREKSLHCSCPQCESCCFEENAVKIVQIQHGYALLILKLYTVYAVHCILICEPRCLIAVDESGRVYIWIMDPTWSIKMEEHIILSYDFLPSRVVELKRVPKSASMVIGHNGYGQFSLWDIAKRTVVTQFSAPASLVLDYHPVSLFRWQNKNLSCDESLKEECVKKLVEESTSGFLGHNELDISCPTDWNDVALWVLMYTSSDSNVPSASFSSNYHSNSDQCWRLGLLVKSTVIMGAALPTSTAAIGTSSGLGIIGTYKGEVDIWELATGNQLGSLHHHAGKTVSHVAVNDASSSIVAIAHDDGQLWVYRNH
ncbi:hypothetical protein RND81_07G176500 [Saponaria officinalis]|uniref:Uncharacterized protein n=1 Tax=Saponaria officinalis TaxID=3572 RepID=A0AAW1JUS0_SAPOF